jgi:hypothetical protein
MYPQTPPMSCCLTMVLYILHSAWDSGFSPTSSKMVYLGERLLRSKAALNGIFSRSPTELSFFYTSQFENYLQKPLKNQLCDDSFWLLRYFITKNIFIFIARRLLISATSILCFCYKAFFSYAESLGLNSFRLIYLTSSIYSILNPESSGKYWLVLKKLTWLMSDLELI